MQAGPEVTRGGTDAVGAGNLVYPMGSLELTFRLLSICTWHPEQAFKHGLPAHTHTHSHSHRQGRESVACVPQRLCPANTAELSAVAVATRLQHVLCAPDSSHPKTTACIKNTSSVCLPSVQLWGIP